MTQKICDTCKRPDERMLKERYFYHEGARDIREFEASPARNILEYQWPRDICQSCLISSLREIARKAEHRPVTKESLAWDAI